MKMSDFKEMSWPDWIPVTEGLPEGDLEDELFFGVASQLFRGSAICTPLGKSTIYRVEIRGGYGRHKR